VEFRHWCILCCGGNKLLFGEHYIPFRLTTTPIIWLLTSRQIFIDTWYIDTVTLYRCINSDMISNISIFLYCCISRTWVVIGWEHQSFSTVSQLNINRSILMTSWIWLCLTKVQLGSMLVKHSNTELALHIFLHSWPYICEV